MPRLLFLALAPALAWGQLDSGIVAVTATTTPAAVASRATLMIGLSAPPGLSLAEAAAILQSVGVSAADFSNLSSYSQPNIFEWMFALDVPLNRLNDRLAALAKIQASLGDTMTLRYQANRTAVYGACNAGELLAAARTRAAQLAVAAGGKLGPIQSLTMPATDSGVGGVGIPTAIYRVGDFYATTTSYYSASCTLLVEFRLAP